MSNFQPMLSATVKKIEDLRGMFPLLASPKLDGIRAIVQGGKIVSRNLKPIPNAFVQRELPYVRLGGLDGELVVGNAYDKDCFRNTSSGVMSADGNPNFTYYIFDRIIDAGYQSRLAGIRDIVAREKNKRLKIVPQKLIKDEFELFEYEEAMLAKGFEGVMLRFPNAPYKFGRSTFREGFLMKLKRFEDSEAEILDCVELEHNKNAATKDAIGRTERSTKKEGKVKGGMLGALHVRDVKTGVEFDIGGGFTEAARKELWTYGPAIIGRVVKYKYFPTGSKDKPRFPVFLGFRDANDNS